MKIAVIDSGIEKKLIDRKCESVSLNGKDEIDRLGHGTLVYSMIRRVGGEEDHVVNVKAINDAGESTIENIISALALCLKRKCDIYNLSFSVIKSIPQCDIRRLSDIINTIVENGAVIFCSAENNKYEDVSVPASLPGVIGVTGALFRSEKQYIYDRARSIQILGNASPVFFRNSNGGLTVFRGNSKATAMLTGMAATWIRNQRNIEDELKINSFDTKWDENTIRELNSHAYNEMRGFDILEGNEYLELFKEYKRERGIEGDLFSKFVRLEGVSTINRFYLDALCFVEEKMAIRFKEESISIRDFIDERNVAYAMQSIWEKYE